MYRIVAAAVAFAYYDIIVRGSEFVANKSRQILYETTITNHCTTSWFASITRDTYVRVL